MIFEAYRRAHNAAGQPASVGLGLSVARKLACLMGGDLRYRRVENSTVFELSLPIASVE
jgi:signal transduction histidine kinase